ncbi:hypothetical protein [Sphingobium abikonense]|uniref:hypothetical protein n=1 Tax=Sphingobium abikonense TaxID=86193 RepID=UPI0035170968
MVNRLIALAACVAIGLTIAGPPSSAQPSFAGEYAAPLRKPVSVRYGTERSQTANFWRASGTQPAPLVIIVDNGGWSTAPGPSTYQLAGTLASHGIAVARLPARPDRLPGVREIVADTTRLMKFLLSQAARRGLRTDQYVIIGVGGGAAPAALMATDDSWADQPALTFSHLRGLVLIEPLGVNPERVVEKMRPDRREEVLEALGETTEARRANSALGHLEAPNTGSVFILSIADGLAESTSADLARLLSNDDIEVNASEMPKPVVNGPRSVFGNEMNNATQEILDYLRKRFEM